MKHRYFLICGLIALAVLIAALILYPQLPDRVPSHWDLHGRVDGYSSRTIAVFFVPGMMVVMMLVFAALPTLSPRRFEVQGFVSTYLYVMVIIVVFLAYIQALVFWAALRPGLSLNRAILGGVCVLLALLGNVLGKVKRNFFIGVRTPWTLANEQVWYATHRLAAKVFVAAGLVGLVIAFIAPQSFAVFGVLIAAGLIPVVYSFVYYKQLERQGVDL